MTQPTNSPSNLLFSVTFTSYPQMPINFINSPQTRAQMINLETDLFKPEIILISFD